MNHIRKVLGFFAALLLALQVLPTNAATSTKFFYASFTGVSLQTSTVDVTFFNATPPPGVSTINSGRIDIRTPSDLNIRITGVTVADTGATVAFSQQLPGQDGALATYILSGFPGIKNGKSLKFRLTLSGLPTSCGTIHWFAYANTGNAYPGGDEFLPTRTDLLTSGVGCTYSGSLGCETTNNAFGDPSTGAAGFRGGNKDASACVVGPYTFLNDIPGSNTVYLSWGGQTSASFMYFAAFNPEFVNDQGQPTSVTLVAWDLLPDNTPRFEIGRACFSNDLPGVLGTLTSAITSTQTTIDVTTSATLPSLPFAIVVAATTPNEPERMTVTAISGSQWTVARGQGGTVAVPHSAGSAVNSTPLPIVNDPASFYFGKQAQICVWKEEWESVGVSYCPLDSTKLCAKVQKKVWVFDIVDGWVSSR